jgi:hypothetical protein
MDGQRFKNVEINFSGVQTSIFCSNFMKQFSVECVTYLPLLIIVTLNITIARNVPQVVMSIIICVR